MPNAKYAGGKSHVNIGTIGHLGHGKTTLTAAIAQILSQRVAGNTCVSYESIDNAREETENGIKISVSRVEYETNNRHYAHVDCPRHVDHLKNMIIAADQMEGAILVVDATTGVMAETIDHIRLSCRIGAPSIVVFMNKCDMVDDTDILEFTEHEIREFLNQYGYRGDDTPIIQGSALKALEGPSSQWGDKIMELLDAVDRWIPTPQREGQQADIEKGNVLIRSGSITCHKQFLAQVYVLTSNEGGRHSPFFNYYRQQFYFRTSEITGECKLPEGEEMCMPGDNMEMSIELMYPIPMEHGLRFVIRDGGRPVAAGKIIRIIG